MMRRRSGRAPPASEWARAEGWILWIAKDGEGRARLMVHAQGERRAVGGAGIGRWGWFASLVLLAGCQAGPDGYKLRPTTAASFLKQIDQEKDPNVRYAAYDSLGSSRVYDDEAQKARTAKILVDKLKAAKEPTATRAVICRTLGNLRRPEAREAILLATNDDDSLVRSEACRALGRVGRSEDATVLARVMTLDSAGECRVAAIESLGELKSKDRRITEYLVTGMEHDDPAIRVASLAALRQITGRDLGVEAGPWKKYVLTLPKSDSPATPGDAEVAKTAGTRP